MQHTVVITRVTFQSEKYWMKKKNLRTRIKRKKNTKLLKLQAYTQKQKSKCMINNKNKYLLTVVKQRNNKKKVTNTSNINQG